MDPEQVPGAILLTLLCVVGALGLWYCGVRWNRLGFKQVAVMVGIAPVIGVGLQIAEPWFDQVEYRSSADGPALRQSSATATVQLPVTNPELHHSFNLTPRIRGENPPRQPVHLKFTVRSPEGDTLAEGEGDLAPAKPEWSSMGHLWPVRFQPLRWQPLRAQFQPREEGEHTLILEIPQPVRRVDVLVRESRK
jgi:hypothetical protein